MLINPELTKGSIELLILSLLEGEEMYGYELTRQIEERSASLLRFRRSSIYPILGRMAERGWLERRWSDSHRRRCYYSLTEDGDEALERQRIEWRAFTAAVNLVVEGKG